MFYKTPDLKTRLTRFGVMFFISLCCALTVNISSASPPHSSSHSKSFGSFGASNSSKASHTDNANSAQHSGGFGSFGSGSGSANANSNSSSAFSNNLNQQRQQKNALSTWDARHTPAPVATPAYSYGSPRYSTYPPVQNTVIYNNGGNTSSGWSWFWLGTLMGHHHDTTVVVNQNPNGYAGGVDSYGAPINGSAGGVQVVQQNSTPWGLILLLTLGAIVFICLVAKFFAHHKDPENTKRSNYSL